MFVARIPPPSCLTLALVLATSVAVLSGPARGAERIVGSGVSRTETRSVSAFRGVALGVPATLELRQGDGESLSITGDDNIVPRVETVVEDGTLKIRWVDGRSGTISYKHLEIVVGARSIESLSIAGSGQIHAPRLKTSSLRMRLDGSGGASIDSLEADSVRASIDGSGSLKAAGRADSLDATVSGSGRLSTARLETRNAKIALAGSGDAMVWATQTLGARVAGSGNVEYYGKPEVRTTIAGSGRVVQASGAP
jgi:hypothetical protein